MKFKIGDRVVRGPDWKWDEQDGNGPGTVVPRSVPSLVDGYEWVSVRWDSGNYNCYRIGPGVRDLAPLTYGNEEED
jgi:hypothetical protein